MKKVILAVVLTAALIGGVVWLWNLQIGMRFLDPKFDVVRRGDLVIPIKASGKIQPRNKREIKSKANGEIISIPFEVGQMVRQNDILVALKRDDEQRMVDAAKAAYDQALIALDTAKITLEQHRRAGVPSAEAARDRAKAQLGRIEVEYKFKERLRQEKPESVSPEELETIRAQYLEAQAMVRAAEVDVVKATIAVDMAEKDVARAERAVESARTEYEDALERLAETQVRSPIDGMILQRFRNVGEVIQSGKTSLTGGTVLMEIADVSEVYMIASVDEADIGKVRALAPPEARPGADPHSATRPASSQPTTAYVEQDVIREQTPVEITVEAFPGERFEGVIERISPESELQQAVATFQVRIRVTSPNRDKIRYLVGMQAEAKFTSVPLSNVLLVPYEAVQRGPNGEQGVYVPVVNPATGKEEPRFRPCEFDVDNGVEVVVRSGLREGERVYTKLPVKTDAERKAEENASD